MSVFGWFVEGDLCCKRCVLSASRDLADERVFHFLFNALRGAMTDADFMGDLQDALTGP